MEVAAASDGAATAAYLRPDGYAATAEAAAHLASTISALPLGIPVAAMAATEFSGAKSHDRPKRSRSAAWDSGAPPAGRRCPCEDGIPSPMKAHLIRRSTWLVTTALFAATAVAWSQAPPPPKRMMLAAGSNEAQPGSTGAATAIVPTRQHAGRPPHRQLPCRCG